MHCKGLELLWGFHCCLHGASALRNSAREGLARKPHLTDTLLLAEQAALEQVQ